MTRSAVLLTLLALAACGPTGVTLAPPPAPPPAPPAPVQKYADAGRWTVDRVTTPDSFFCVAAEHGPGPQLAITETRAGLVGLDVPETTHTAEPGARAALALAFDARAPLVVNAGLNGPGRLATLPPEGRERDELGRALSRARTLTVRLHPEGPVLGSWDLSGAAAALDTLGQCARRA